MTMKLGRIGPTLSAQDLVWLVRAIEDEAHWERLRASYDIPDKDMQLLRNLHARVKRIEVNHASSN